MTSSPSSPATEPWLNEPFLSSLRSLEDLEETDRNQVLRITEAHWSPARFAEIYLPHHFMDEETGERIPFGAHHHELFDCVEEIGSDKHVARAEPREHGKSTVMDLIVMLWWLATGRKHFIVLVSDTASQAEGHLLSVTAEIEENHLLQRDYPHLLPALDRKGQLKKWTDREIINRAGQVVAAVGAGKSIRGLKRRQYRPDAVIIDDLEKDESVESKRQRDKLEAWLLKTLLSLGGKGCDYYYVGTILHHDSVLARVIHTEEERAAAGFDPIWDVRIFAAEDEEGNILWPERWSRERLDAKRAVIGSRAYAQEFLNNPSLWEGGLFRREWFPMVKDYPQDARVVRYWDQAATQASPGKDPDWTAGAKVAYKRGQYWVLDVIRTRTTPGGVEELTKQTAALDGREVQIWAEEEGGASGKNNTHHYQRDVVPGYFFKGYRSSGSKVQRAGPVSSAAEAGNVFILPGPWNIDFLDEMEAFPEGAHDDQVDAVSGAFAVLFEKPEAPVVGPPALVGKSRWRS